jgi:SAM-dependent methyltransferase
VALFFSHHPERPVLRKLLERVKTVDRLYRFNRVERVRWVAAEAAALPPGSAVLDVGAGTAPHRAHFAHCAYRAHDFGKLERAQLQDGDAYYSPDYVSDILCIPVPASSFDAVLCTEVLEHVPEPIKAVAELARILRPGGRLLLSAPLGSGLHQEPFHFYGGYTPYWYRRFLAEAGFVDVEVRANGGAFKFLGQELLRGCASLTKALMNPKQWRYAPAYILSWLLLIGPALLIPPFAAVLDRLDVERRHTVGYFVSATKRPLATSLIANHLSV